MNWRYYIVAEPEVRIGKPVPKGKRMAIERILDRLRVGWRRELGQLLLCLRPFAESWALERQLLVVGFDGFRKRAPLTVA
jgi:hypothetical protein